MHAWRAGCSTPRHSFCTKLAEAGEPESTMLDIMGHMSTAMLRRYSHIRAQAAALGQSNTKEKTVSH
ncbi:MAG: tyrosine-type recombinase/integrase [Acidobacteriia bacterium]|nr:tyrosine-type recombinase/integrase [Terriglobia bacterium]